MRKKRMAVYGSYFECFVCGKSFAHATTLHEHENYSCQTRVLFACIPCGLTFDSDWLLDQHLIRHQRGGRSWLFSKKELNCRQYKCDHCETSFISSFTLVTHQLYSCPAFPATCAILQRNPSDGTTAYSHDAPESSEDEGKLQIVENEFYISKSNFSSEKNLACKYSQKKSLSSNTVEDLKNEMDKKENVENICENNDKTKNKLTNCKNKIVTNVQINDRPSEATGHSKDLNIVLNLHKGKENGFGTNKILESPSNIDSMNVNSGSSNKLIRSNDSEKQFNIGLNSDTIERQDVFTNNETMPKQSEVSNSVEERVPLKVVFKIKHTSQMKALPLKPNQFNPDKLSNVADTKIGSHASAITAATNSAAQKLINNTAVYANESVGAISDDVGNDISEKEQENEGSKKCLRLTGKVLKVVKGRRNIKQKAYPCRPCGRCFAHPETRDCHESIICRRNVTDKDHETFICSKCDFVLATSRDYDLHIVMKCCPVQESFNTRDSKPVSCKYCARQFVQESTLETHLDYCCSTKTEIFAKSFENIGLIMCCK